MLVLGSLQLNKKKGTKKREKKRRKERKEKREKEGDGRSGERLNCKRNRLDVWDAMQRIDETVVERRAQCTTYCLFVSQFICLYMPSRTMSMSRGEGKFPRSSIQHISIIKIV
jgi:hypothetical protein